MAVNCFVQHSCLSPFPSAGIVSNLGYSSSAWSKYKLPAPLGRELMSYPEVPCIVIPLKLNSAFGRTEQEVIVSLQANKCTRKKMSVTWNYQLAQRDWLNVQDNKSHAKGVGLGNWKTWETTCSPWAAIYPLASALFLSIIWVAAFDLQSSKSEVGNLQRYRGQYGHL